MLPPPASVSGVQHPRYTRLDAAKVELTIDRLHQRIAARFPERNLGNVALEIGEVAHEVVGREPAPWVRVLTWACRLAIVVVGLLGPGLVLAAVGDGLAAAPHTADWLGIGESAINDLVFAGVAILFLWAVPTRIQRAADLRVLHRLRSLAHVVDMHQLTKDPDRFLPGFTETEASANAHLSPAELSRYLDYCSEMLSLIGKTGAILAENNNDPIVLAGVQGIEDLTTEMSRKIWQKIALLPRTAPAVGADLSAP